MTVMIAGASLSRTIARCCLEHAARALRQVCRTWLNTMSKRCYGFRSCSREIGFHLPAIAEAICRRRGRDGQMLAHPRKPQNYVPRSFAESFGAVMLDPVLGRQEVLGAEVPEHVVRAWRSGGERQIMYFAELYPILVAKKTWKDAIQGRRVIFFIDNEAVKISFVRNYSSQVNATALLLVPCVRTAVYLAKATCRMRPRG